MSGNSKKVTKTIILSLLVIVGLVGLYYLAPFAFLAFTIIKDNKTRQPDIIYDHPLVDRSFITEGPCSPPCWYGINPGETTLVEANEIVHTLAFTEDVKEVGGNGPDENISLYVYCPYIKSKPATPCVLIFSVDDTVDSITHQISYNLSFQDAITKLGTPDYYVADRIPGSCFISLNWIDRGISVEHWDLTPEICDLSSRNGETEIPLNILITEIQYVSSDYFPDCNDAWKACHIW